MDNKRGSFWYGWFAAVLMLFATAVMAADGVRPNASFNHDRTLFPLTGVHTNTACENCHLKGVFKGTPKDCNTCHSRGGAMNAQVKPPTHIPVTQECRLCHTTSGWLPASFSHQLLKQSCASCHNGTNETGKPPTHLVTSKDCGECHRTTAWVPAGYDHAGIDINGNCSSCHNGATATGKSARHIPTNLECGTCHKNFIAWTPAGVDHLLLSPPATGRCSSCHGKTATGKPNGHIITPSQCDTCHRSTVSWLPADFTHGPADTNCQGCHNGSTATGKPPVRHIQTSQQCSTCHTQAGWSPTSFDHSKVSAANNCSTCHNGSSATGKSASHLPVTQQCDVCHTTAAWRPSAFAHSSAQIAGKSCSQCHNGTAATGRPTTGLRAHTTAPMTGDCAACHTTSAWQPAPMNHAGATNCAACHTISSGGNAWTPGKTSHISTAGFPQCASCHRTSTWKPSTFSHQGITTASNCGVTCHNGTNASGRPVSGAKAHTVSPMTSSSCGSCHGIGTSWIPARMNHAGVVSCRGCHTYTGNSWTPAKTGHLSTTAQCASCHTVNAWLPATFSHTVAGVTAATNCTQSGCHDIANAAAPRAGRPTAGAKAHAQAPMTSSTCASCHAIGTTWTAVTMNHSGASACSTCHTKTGNAWTPTPATTHIATTTECSSCHATTKWTGATFSHDNVSAATSCTQSGCHDVGGRALPRAGKPLAGAKAHAAVPMSNVNCGSCHAVGTSWTPAVMNHTGATSCTSCHATGGNAFTPAKANHISTAGYAQCASCHATTAWKPTAFAHSGITPSTNCSTCHNGTAATGRPLAGTKAHSAAPMSSANCGTCHTVGTSWTPATMNHSGASSCASCHATGGNAFTPAKTNHISTAGYAQCSSCHSTTAWVPTSFAHTGVTSATNCTTCHNGTAATGRPGTGPKAHTVTPMTSNACGACHSIGTAWTAAVMNHAGATSCTACHTYAGNGFTPAKVTHISTTTQCASCHTTTAWLPATFSHQGVTSSTTCTQSGCHGVAGEPTPKAGRPGTHANAPMNASTCAACHTIGGAWTPATMSHTGATACGSCHAYNSSNSWTLPSPVVSHVTTASQCSACHATSAWKPATGTHNGVTSSTNCFNGCHNGNAATGRPSSGAKAHTVAPLTDSTCGSCHAIGTVWTPATMNHTGATGCTSCHTVSGNGFTPAKLNHISTSGYPQCSSCHAVSAWLPTAFQHSGIVASDSCTSCHNGSAATGRPTSGARAHTVAPMTANACGNCHTIGTAWTPATMNHTGVTGCTSCHTYSGNGWTPAKAGHLSTTAQCSSCHTSNAWLPASFNHASNGVTSATNCTQSGCHAIANAAPPKAGRPTTGSKAHAAAPMTANTCASCHTIGGNWTPATMNHTGAVSCTSCHVTAGNGFTPAKANHIAIGSQQCASCHLTTAWLPATGTHNGVTSSSDCFTGCHNSTAATGRPTSGAKPHSVSPLTSNNCGSCHAIGTTWTPATMNHTGATSCTSCHVTAGNGFTPAKLNHIATTGYPQCSSCHKTTMWTPTSFNHGGVTSSTNCTTCHNGTSASGVPTGAKAHTVAPMTATTCGSCHTVGGAWTPATMNHTGATSCISCHATAGNGFTPAKLNHISTTGYPQCSSCHMTTMWTPTSFNHSGVTSSANCTTCHNGTSASGVPTGAKAHTVAPMTAATCGSCHTVGGAWTPATMNHTGATSCTSCHATAGNGFTPAKLNHISTTGYPQCSSCHKTTMWTPTSFNHSGVTSSTNCTTCHNGTSASGVPTGAKAHTVAPMTATTCGSCHTVGGAWTPATMNHTGATSCTSCHATSGNGFTPAKLNHISTTGYPQCASCHTTTAWTPTTFNHSGISGNCSTCHNGSAATGPTGSHAGVSPSTYQCNACHNISGWLPPAFSHSGVTTGCSNCHKAGFATPKSSAHFITSQGCEKCHNTTAWAPIKAYTHTSINYKTHTGLSMSNKADCLLCHINNNESISGAPHKGNAAYKPNCAWCHATQYKSGSHKKTQSPTTVYYTVAELKDCSGACHEYTNNTFSAVKRTRTGQHKSTDGGF